jgi:type II secretory pathway component PulC
VHKLSDTEYRVARALVDRVLQDPSRWLQVRAVPESPGLRLQRIAPGSLLAVLGLRDGDRLDAVNGFSLGDAEAMMLAFARLRTERHLVVRLQRGGKEVDLDIHVV